MNYWSGLILLLFIILLQVKRCEFYPTFYHFNASSQFITGLYSIIRACAYIKILGISNHVYFIVHYTKFTSLTFSTIVIKYPRDLIAHHYVVWLWMNDISWNGFDFCLISSSHRSARLWNTETSELCVFVCTKKSTPRDIVVTGILVICFHYFIEIIMYYVFYQYFGCIQLLNNLLDWKILILVFQLDNIASKV